MSITTDAIRNIAIAGHVGTGKTSLLEQILYHGGVISRPETVESGKTISDYTDEEIERKISIHTALTNIQWKDTKLNLLDTPGSSDFIGEVIPAFRVAESTLILVGARSSVQIETLKLWRRLDERNIPRVVFINKLDIERADFNNAITDLREKFSNTFVPVTIPIGESNNYRGIVNLIENKAYFFPEEGNKEKTAEVPDDLTEIVEESRTSLIESAAEGDDKLLEKYFEEGTLSPDEIRDGLTKGFRANKFVPVLCGSAIKNLGIISLLNFLSNTAPSPQWVVEHGKNQTDEEVTVNISTDGLPSGFVFKTSIDQFAGKLSFIKVITGKFHPDMDIYNPREQKKERISKVFTAQGRKLEELKEIVAGDLGVLTKLGTVTTNDTLCMQDNIVYYTPLNLPNPVHSVTVSAGSKKDEDKLNQFLQKSAEEDLTFRVDYNQETRETVISGMGELHINMILDKIRESQKIEVNTRIPQVAYRETITKPADAEYTHKKQSGGHGQYGRVNIKIRPLERGKYYEFENAIRGMAISKGYIPGIEKGLHDAMESGVLAGYPVVDVGITLVDGKEHPVDSSEMSFRLAAKGALNAAMTKANPVLLEPIMKLTVYVDDQYLGDVLSDLSARRGRVLGQKPVGGGIQEVTALVPQAELLRYSIDLRSITSGTASFEMEFDHYSPISGKIAEAVINSAREKRKEAS
ncbi:MAG: elongation factor G [Spirochaetes bacterium]|nr:MAG: elongation factor G [Spirochaetota bacterium]